MSEPLAKVTYLDDYRGTATAELDAETRPSLGAADVGGLAEAGATELRGFPDFYPERQEMDGVRELLDEALGRAESAINELDAGQVVPSDDEVTKLQRTLELLFAYRDQGEGLATLNVAMVTACSHRPGGAFLTRTQLAALRGVLSELRRGPFLSEQAALGMIDGLESAGLTVDPPVLDALVDLAEV